jgi:hypothetical protein
MLLELGPDYLGFRGALCEGSLREERLEPRRLLAVREALDETRRVPPEIEIDRYVTPGADTNGAAPERVGP